MKKFIYFSGLLVIPLIIISLIHIQIVKTAQLTPPSNIPYLIVLGAKVNGEEMSLSLQYRAKTALSYLEDNPKTVVIVTGGKGKGENITEAEALRRFFIENHINENRILVEDRSTSTYENLKFTKELYEIDEAVIVSNDFHLYRATTFANKVGITGYPLAAETPKVVKATLFIREYAAVIKMIILGS
ncbi:YdcF family protein [Cytobacillus praedii]|uniref:YdcF family protein n=1 Tax=Cytobacillus praedii TaxID=1742358 RepID=A0A4R1AT78_9BACI|nr:YdcF family protein [Cytobacillus praedii]MED3553438.1 YdcF family protein [Cytobacillus praedii]TCJ02873.1 YdcF family protein [Cytobacillus praedii]